MSRMKLWILPLFLLVLGMAGCAQDSIFYNVSNEIVPKDPDIAGSPTKIVKIGAELFVASGRIYKYTNNSGVWSWNPLETNPGPFVVDISSVGGVLYALTVDGSTTEVWKRSDGANWDAAPIPNNTGYPSIQAIFGTSDRLFAAGAREVTDSSSRVFEYAILYEEADKFQILKEGTISATITNEEDGKDVVTPATRVVEKLSGAGKIGSTYYLATLGNGILSVPDSLDSAGIVQVQEVIISDNNDKGANGVINGLIQVTEKPSGDKLEYELIIAASKDGWLYTCSSISGAFEPKHPGSTLTGALALANATYIAAGSEPTVMLLVGIRGGIYNYGYREMLFNLGSGKIEWDAFEIPGNVPSTVTNEPKYRASLGNYPVKSIISFIEPGGSGEQRLFASTQSNGLYSYRDEEWNAEQ